MTIRWLLAAFHLLALGIGLGSVFIRGRTLLGTLDTSGLRRVFQADTFWGVAALLWISTGLLRAFGGFEKGTIYYMNSSVFWLKMTFLLAILILEIRPMLTFIRWRSRLRAGETVDPASAPALARISFVQTALIALMVLAATAMARGIDF